MLSNYDKGLVKGQGNDQGNDQENKQVNDQVSNQVNNRRVNDYGNITSKEVRIGFTPTGWKQLERLNSKSMQRIRAFILQWELSSYLLGRLESGMPMDEGCQEICYESGVYLLLRKMQDIWYITDVYAAEVPTAFLPVFVWQRIQRGARQLLVHILTGWRSVSEKAIGGVSSNLAHASGNPTSTSENAAYASGKALCYAGGNAAYVSRKVVLA